MILEFWTTSKVMENFKPALNTPNPILVAAANYKRSISERITWDQPNGRHADGYGNG